MGFRACVQISVGRFDDEGFCSTFRNGQWKLTKCSFVVAKDRKLYVMHAKLSQDTLSVAENDSTVELWHKRLCHMSEKTLARRNVLPGLDEVHLDKCPDCMAGKQNRVAFKITPPSRMKNVLNLIHLDLRGPLTMSYGGN